MDRKLETFLRLLRNLSKCYKKLRRATPDPRTAARNADLALDEVLKALDDPEIANVIAELIPMARERILSNPAVFQQKLNARHEELVKIEVKVCHHSGARRRDIETMYLQYRSVGRQVSHFVSNIDDLRQELLRLHEAVKKQIEASRQKPRVPKKKRKRNVAMAAASAVFGAAVIIADAPSPAVFSFSYGLGGSAVFQAMRDLIRTRE